MYDLKKERIDEMDVVKVQRKKIKPCRRKIAVHVKERKKFLKI